MCVTIYVSVSTSHWQWSNVIEKVPVIQKSIHQLLSLKASPHFTKLASFWYHWITCSTMKFHVILFRLSTASRTSLPTQLSFLSKCSAGIYCYTCVKFGGKQPHSGVGWLNLVPSGRGMAVHPYIIIAPH